MNVPAANSASEQAFQRCGSCGRLWNRWQDFVLDPGIRLIGLQAIPGLPDANLLIFEHRCGSTTSVLAKRLRHILPESLRAQEMPNLFGSDTCNQHCRSLEDLSACDRFCVNARDRQLILLLLSMKNGPD
jgi:hypothetical protein